MKYIERNLVVGPFQCNCRLLVCPVTGDAALIDPGDEPKKILSALSKVEWKDENGAVRRPKLKYLLHTHAHLDHIGGTRGVVEGLAGAGTPPEIALHQGDEFIYSMLKKQGEMFGFQYDDPLPVTKYLTHEEEITVGKLKLEVIHTPGHSPGGISLRLHEDSEFSVPESVFSGDTLFQGSVGRTDLWGADGELMIRSIRERLLTLDGDTRVCPGHGAESRIGVELRENPFLK